MCPQATAPDERVTSDEIALPPRPVSLTQDREWCVVEIGGEWRKIRFHDYDEIYAIPGLYEALFYEALKCNSPGRIREILQRCLNEARVAPNDLRVLDLGAGNGMVAEELAGIGVRQMVGVDIIRAAAAAAERDRQGLYEEYFVADMTDVPQEVRRSLESRNLNCLTCVAALGFGDIPPAAFANSFNMIVDGGWVAFNIKSGFLERGEGFGGLIRRMIDEGVLKIRTGQEYEHRIATNGEPLMYTAFVGTKRRDVPAEWIG
jgi:hypothetical protein